MPINIFWDDGHSFISTRYPSCLREQLTDWPKKSFLNKAKFVFFDIRRCRLKFLTWYKPNIVSVLETAALWPGCVAHFLYLSLGTGDLREGRWWDGPHTGIAHHAPQRKLAIMMIPLTPMKACFVSPMRNGLMLSVSKSLPIPPSSVE